MALKWFENMGTQLNSKAWSESVEEAKVTNVFGLAWNYYVAYTKFITGLDLTLDMDVKAEFFYAWTYKIGYAKETNFNSATKISANECVSDFHTSVSSAYGSVQSVITEALAQITARTNNVEEDTLIVDEANHDFGVLSQVINEDLVTNVGGDNTQNSDTHAINAVTLNINTTGAVAIDGDIVSIGN